MIGFITAGFETRHVRALVWSQTRAAVFSVASRVATGAERVGEGIVDARCFPDAPGEEVHLLDDVLRAVDTDVEPRTEHVLMHLRVHSRRDEDAVLRRAVAAAVAAVLRGALPRGEKIRGQHPGELDLVLHAAVLVEVPVEQVLVVHHGRDEGDHELARAPRLVVPVAILHVFP